LSINCNFDTQHFEISFPLLQDKRLSVIDQFSNVTNEILSELKSLKKERSFFLRKLLDSNERCIDAKKSNDEAFEGDKIIGRWNSNSGLVRIGMYDDDIVGEYQYNSNDWIGDITGM